MKRLLFATVMTATIATTFAGEKKEEKHWIQEKIEMCMMRDKRYRDISWQEWQALTASEQKELSNSNQACDFLHTYIERFYPMMCAGQGYNGSQGLYGGYPSYTVKDQGTVCNHIHSALAQQKFAEKMAKYY